MGRARWLAIGIGIKRWLLLLGLGAGVAGMGIVYAILMLRRAGWMPGPVYSLVTLQPLPLSVRVWLPLVAGGLLMLFAINRLGNRLLAPYRLPGDPLIERLAHYSQRRRGPHVVAIGGGTGLPILLRGLVKETSNITAIVTVADDGGSSGRLRRELGMLPPGDIRNNMAALARDEALMTQLLQYRFGGAEGENGSGSLGGHAFGNLLLAALAGITGSFDEGLLAAERVLALQGRVMPATLDMVRLVADVRLPQSGLLQRVAGESSIPKAAGVVERLYLEPETARPYPPAIQAIFQADLIVIGPGSLFTSILPNLLIPGFAEALRHAPATRVFVCNLATQPGETDNYSVAQHVQALLHYLPADCLDVVLANDNLSLPETQGGGQTHYVTVTPSPAGKLITADLVDEEKPWRHDSRKLATALTGLL